MCLKLHHFLLMLGMIPTAYAQTPHQFAGGRSAALSYAAAALNGAEAIFHNQAALINTEENAIVWAWDNRFGVQKLHTHYAAAILHVPEGIIGLRLSRHGFDAYNESLAGLSYTRAFSPRFSASLQLNLLHTHAPDFQQSDLAIYPEIGLFYRIDDKWQWGMHVHNPLRGSRSGEKNDLLPLIMRTGFVCQFSEKLMLSVEAHKDIAQPLSLRTGLEWSLLDVLFLRTGMDLRSRSNSFGLGYALGQLQFDMAFLYTSGPGLSPNASLIYAF